MGKQHYFSAFAKIITDISGRPMSFLISFFLVLLWVAGGPHFGWSDSYQLYINTSTTIITFLMVFLIQNSQNRESAALQLKIDELIRANAKAHNALLDLEEMELRDLNKLRKEYETLAKDARERLRRKGIDHIFDDIDEEDK